MAVEVTLTLPNQLYHRVEKLAQASDWDVSAYLDSLLVKAVERTIARDESVAEVIWAEPDEAVEREKATYIAMHPALLEKYWGMHVAIRGGELVDYDDDGATLSERIYEQYPDEFVWISQVKEEPIETLVFRSPRFISNDE
ncbi:MAG: hypothetical protein KJ638_02020 [Chloroflexi bacterium]|nr:hypothetical protein [Chloroflexota bacterium]